MFYSLTILYKTPEQTRYFQTLTIGFDFSWILIFILDGFIQNPLIIPFYFICNHYLFLNLFRILPQLLLRDILP